MKKRIKPPAAIEPVRELWELDTRLRGAEAPTNEDVQRFQHLAVASPAAWHLVCDSMQSIQQELIGKISHGVSRAHLQAEMEIRRKEFGYDQSSVLEQLMIDSILTAHLRLVYIECACNIEVNREGSTQRAIRFWEEMLASAQMRFLRAVETLARVRRLARNSSALQINIANDGGRQVNIQGQTECG
ncbi:MAG: hypothetical protein KJ579_07900 [Verrucomicrobia bacterium]|nr:hypothetical protein [Verrucomicrobiota bacterium]